MKEMKTLKFPNQDEPYEIVDAKAREMASVQPDLSQTDATQPDYVKGVIRQESLPEGYPYKTGGSFDLCSTEGDERVEFNNQYYSTVYVRVSDLTPSFAELQAATITSNGQSMPYTDADRALTDKGDYTALFGGEFGLVTYKPNTETVIGTLSTPGIWISNKHAEQYGASAPDGLVVTYGAIHTMAPEYLPDTIQRTITGTPGQFVVIGDDGNPTTKTIFNAEEASF